MPHMQHMQHAACKLMKTYSTTNWYDYNERTAGEFLCSNVEAKYVVVVLFLNECVKVTKLKFMNVQKIHRCRTKIMMNVNRQESLPGNIL